MKAYCKNTLLFNNIKVANSFLDRLIGLLGKNYIGKNEGLLLTKCSSIHCFFMKFDIDVVYLSEDMKVLYIETVKPWGIGKIVKKTKNVLELHQDASVVLNIDDVITFIE